MGLDITLAVVIPDFVVVAELSADFTMNHVGGLDWPRSPHLLLPDTINSDHMIDNYHSHSCSVGFKVVAKTDFDRNINVRIDAIVASSSSFGLKLS